MARTIGKVKIRKLEDLVTKVMKEQRNILGVYGMSIDYMEVDRIVKERIPEEWYNIWECAWQEINRIIHDKINEIIYR